jgi:DNA-binding Lrp family transcriptional regulator
MTSETELAKVVGSSLQAVKRRLRRLRAQKAFVDVPVISPDLSTLRARAVVALNVDMQALPKQSRARFHNLQELLKFLYRDLLRTEGWLSLARDLGAQASEVRIEGVYSVAGAIDVVVVVAATRMELITKLVENVIDQVRGVRRSVTFNITGGHFFPVHTVFP